MKIMNYSIYLTLHSYQFLNVLHHFFSPTKQNTLLNIKYKGFTLFTFQSDGLLLST